MFSANVNNKMPISIVQKDKLWGIVDSANRVIVTILYDDCKVLVNTCALWKGQTVSFWDFKGEKLPIGEYDTVLVHKKNTLDAYLAVKKNGKWGFINVWEATSIPNMVYDSVYLPVKDRNGKNGFSRKG
ncbi:MAG: WG repeat-containing protein [Sphingobacteriales bacterium]|nr:WG repeat-containing protein [Sphingobacteriales bacterium]